MSFDGTGTDQRPGEWVVLFGRMPLEWDKRKHIQRDGQDYREDLPIQLEAELIVTGVRPIPLNVVLGDTRGAFSISFPVAYPPGVERAKIAFKRIRNGATLTTWIASHLPKTHIISTGTKSVTSFTSPDGSRVEAWARPERSADPRGAPDEIVVGASVHGSKGMVTYLRNVRLGLPFACPDGTFSSSRAELAGGSKLMVALPTPYAFATPLVHLEAELSSAQSRPLVLKLGKVLLQRTDRGWTVAGRRWAKKVDGYQVFLSEPTDRSKRSPDSEVSFELTVSSATDSTSWFEAADPHRGFAGKADRMLYVIPRAKEQREIDLTIPGRIVKLGGSSKVNLVVPVALTPIPKPFPRYSSGLSIEPYIEGSLGGYSFSD